MNTLQAASLIRNQLANTFSDPHDRIELEATNTERVFGYVVSGSFIGVDSPERQERVWRALESLSPEAKQLITIVLALTPSELAEDDD